LILDQKINYDRLVNDLQITNNRSQSNKFKNKKIQNAKLFIH